MKFASASRVWVSVRRALWRTGLFALLWWVCTEGSAVSWGLGIPTVGAAVWISMTISPASPWRWRMGGLLRFVPFFICRSFVGGVDVARRALQRSLPLHPTLLEYPWRLPPGPVRIFFANTTNLLPGTLSAELQDERLVLHVLDVHQPIVEELQALESRVAALFGLRLPSADGGEERNDA